MSEARTVSRRAQLGADRFFFWRSNRALRRWAENTVKIWSLRPLEDEDAEAAGEEEEVDEAEEQQGNDKKEPGADKVPRLLATLTNHQLGVNCVRWSPDGALLASGGDDKVVILWSLESGRTTVFGQENIENWTPVAMLRGHTGDVTGLAWSPDGQWLCSSSTDNSIIVWNGRKDSLSFGKQLTVLKAHKEIVNGIAFDPHGSLLVSQAAGELIFWRTSDWQVEKTIRDPFDSSSASSFFYRPSWSPDSMNVVVPHVSVGGNANAAAVLQRSTGQFELSFLGHREPTTVTSYNPQLFRSGASDKPYAVVAIASQDGAISFWATCSERPVAVLVGQFSGKAVTDISWTPDGMKLLASSTDGTVLYAEFDSDELGFALSEQERAAVISQQKKGILERSPVLDDPMLMQMQAKGQQLKRAAIAAVSSPKRGGRAVAAPEARLSGSQILSMQTETKAPDGRRRIKPVFLGDSAGSPATSVSQPASEVVFAQPAPASKRRKQTPAAPAPAPAATAEADDDDVVEVSSSQPAKRAMASSSSNAAAPTAAAPRSAASNGGGGGAKKRRTAAAAAAEAAIDVPAIFESSDGHRIVHVAVSEETLTRKSDWLPEGVRGPRTLVLEAQNDGTLRLQLDLHTLWERPLSGKIVALCANEHFVVAVVSDFDDGTCSCLVYCFFSGVLAVPRMALPSLPAGLCLSTGYGPTHLMIVSSQAHVGVWDLVRRKSKLQVSAADVLRSGPSLSRCLLMGDRNAATLVLSNGVCFSYCTDMCVWTCVHDAPKYALSDFQGNTNAAAAADLLGANAPLFSMQNYAASAALESLAPAASALFGGKKGRSSEGATMYHLEHQVLAAWQLRSTTEMRYWTQTYATHLVDRLASLMAFEDRGGPRPEELLRLRSLCEFLMGERTAGNAAISPETAQKRALLKDIVLPILSTQQSFASWVQRYSVELK